ncbi:hypothetical protein DFQ26_000457 [Actinomortierella ambigua]|nr:hypothetical protein DFQ26_000457 [Actinomortierella ambigua]
MKRSESSIPAKRAHASSSQQRSGSDSRSSSKQRRSNSNQSSPAPSEADNASNTRASSSSSSALSSVTSSADSSPSAGTSTAVVSTPTSSPTRSRRRNAGQRRPVYDPSPSELLRRVSGGRSRMESPAHDTPPPRQQKSSNDSSNSPSPSPSGNGAGQAEEQGEQQGEGAAVFEPTEEAGPATPVQQMDDGEGEGGGGAGVSSPLEPSVVIVEAEQGTHSPITDITKRSFYAPGRGSTAATVMAPEEAQTGDAIKRFSFSSRASSWAAAAVAAATAVVRQTQQNVVEEMDVEPEEGMETDLPEMAPASAPTGSSSSSSSVTPSSSSTTAAAPSSQSAAETAVTVANAQPMHDAVDMDDVLTQELNESELEKEEQQQEHQQQEQGGKVDKGKAVISVAKEAKHELVPTSAKKVDGDGDTTSTTTTTTTAPAAVVNTSIPSPPQPESSTQPQPSIPSHLADDFAPDSPRKQVTYSPSKQDQQKKFEPMKNAHRPKSILKKTPARPIFTDEAGGSSGGGSAHHSSRGRGNFAVSGGAGSGIGGGSSTSGSGTRRAATGQAPPPPPPPPLSIGAHEEFVKDACKILERTENVQERLAAYHTLQNKLRICDDQRHMPEFQACIRQYAAFFARDLAMVPEQQLQLVQQQEQPPQQQPQPQTSSSSLLLQYCLRCAGYFLFHPQTVNMLTVDEVETLLSRIVTIAETTTDRSLCSMALYCLGIQQTPLRLWQQRAVFSTIVPTMVNAMNARARSNSVVHEALKSLLNVFHHRPDEMARHLEVWLVPVCLDLLHAVPGIRSKALDIITFALPHLMALESGQVQRALRGFVQEKYEEFFKRLDEKHIQNGDEIYGITVWGCMVSLLGKYLQKTAQLNPVLKIAERCFNSNSPERTEIVMAAFQAWTRFIYVMANCGNLAQERAVQLMLTPIKSCFATENRRRVRLACTNTWIALVFALDTKLPLFHQHVLTPILGKVLTDDSEHVRDLGLRFLKALFAGEGGDKILEGEAFNLHGAKYRNSKPAWADLVFFRTQLISLALSGLGGAFKTQYRIVDSSRDQWKVDDTTELNLVTMPLAHAWESIVTAICDINNSEKDIRVSDAAVSSLKALLKFAREVSRMNPALLMPKDWPAGEKPQFELLKHDRDLAGLILRADITYYLLSTIIQAFSYRTLMAGRYRVTDDLYAEIQEALAQGSGAQDGKVTEGQQSLAGAHSTTPVKGAMVAGGEGGGLVAAAPTTLSNLPTPSSSTSSSVVETQQVTPFEYILKTWMELGESVIKTPFDNWFWEGVASMTNYVMGDTHPMRMLFRCFALLKDIERKRSVATSNVVWPAWNRKAHPLLFFELQLKYFSLIAKRLSDAMENKMECDKMNACTTPEDDENIMVILMYPGYIFQSTAKWAESEAEAQQFPPQKASEGAMEEGNGHGSGASGLHNETAEYEIHTTQWWQSYRAIYYASWKELVQRLVEAKKYLASGGGKTAAAPASATAGSTALDGHETLNLLASRLRTAFIKHRRVIGHHQHRVNHHHHHHGQQQKKEEEEEGGGEKSRPVKNAGQAWYYAHACVSTCGLVEIMRWVGPPNRTTFPGTAAGLLGRKDKQLKKNPYEGLLELCSLLFQESLTWIQQSPSPSPATITNATTTAAYVRKNLLVAESVLELMKWLFHMAPTPATAISWMVKYQTQLAPWFQDPDQLLPPPSRSSSGIVGGGGGVVPERKVQPPPGHESGYDDDEEVVEATEEKQVLKTGEDDDGAASRSNEEGQEQGQEQEQEQEQERDLKGARMQCMGALDLAWHSMAMRLKEHAAEQMLGSFATTTKGFHRGMTPGDEDSDWASPMKSAAGSILPPILPKIRAAAAAAAAQAQAQAQAQSPSRGSSLQGGASPFLVNRPQQRQQPPKGSTDIFQFDSAGLASLKTLFLATLGSTRKTIVVQAIECWNETFGLLLSLEEEEEEGEEGEGVGGVKGAVLEYPPELFLLLRALKQYAAELSLPSWQIAETRYQAEKAKRREALEEARMLKGKNKKEGEEEEGDTEEIVETDGFEPTAQRDQTDPQGEVMVVKEQKEEADDDDDDEQARGFTASQSSVPEIPMYASQSQELSIPAELVMRTTTIGRQMQKKAAAATAAVLTPSRSTPPAKAQQQHHNNDGVTTKKRKLGTEPSQQQQQSVAPRRNPLLEGLENMQELLKSPSPPVFKSGGGGGSSSGGGLRAPMPPGLVLGAGGRRRRRRREGEEKEEDEDDEGQGSSSSSGSNGSSGSSSSSSRRSRRLARMTTSRRVLSMEAMSATLDDKDGDDDDVNDVDDDGGDQILASSPTRKRGMAATMMKTRTVMPGGSGAPSGYQQQQKQQQQMQPRQQSPSQQRPATLTRVLMKPYDPQADPMPSASPSLPLSTLSPTMESIAAVAVEDADVDVDAEEQEGGIGEGEKGDGGSGSGWAMEELQDGRDDGDDNVATSTATTAAVAAAADKEEKPDTVMQIVPVDDETTPQKQQQSPPHPPPEDEVMVGDDEGDEAMSAVPQLSQQQPPSSSSSSLTQQERASSHGEAASASVSATATASGSAPIPTPTDTTATAAGLLAMLDGWIEESPRVVREMDMRQLHAVQDRLQRLSQVVSQAWGERIG